MEFVAALAFFAVISAPVVAVIAGAQSWYPPARRYHSRGGALSPFPNVDRVTTGHSNGADHAPARQEGERATEVLPFRKSIST